MGENIIEINGLEYVLVSINDTSAPCSNCDFLERPSLSCIHPDPQNRHCEHNLGTEKGWNTKEYQAKDKWAHFIWVQNSKQNREQKGESQ